MTEGPCKDLDLLWVGSIDNSSGLDRILQLMLLKIEHLLKTA